MAVTVRPVRLAWTRPAAAVVGPVLLGLGLMFGMAAFGNRYGEGLGWFGVAAVGVSLLSSWERTAPRC